MLDPRKAELAVHPALGLGEAKLYADFLLALPPRPRRAKAGMFASENILDAFDLSGGAGGAGAGEDVEGADAGGTFDEEMDSGEAGSDDGFESDGDSLSEEIGGCAGKDDEDVDRVSDDLWFERFARGGVDAVASEHEREDSGVLAGSRPAESQVLEDEDWDIGTKKTRAAIRAIERNPGFVAKRQRAMRNAVIVDLEGEGTGPDSGAAEKTAERASGETGEAVARKVGGDAVEKAVEDVGPGSKRKVVEEAGPSKRRRIVAERVETVVGRGETGDNDAGEASEEIVYYSSSDDAVNDDNLGERPGYGFLFRSGPNTFTVDSMTEDDLLKMEGMSWERMCRLSQKYSARVSLSCW